MRVPIIEDSQVLRRLIQTCFRDFDFTIEAQRLPHTPHRRGGSEQAEAVMIGMYQPLNVGLGIIRRLRLRTDPPAVIALTTDTREKSISLIVEAGRRRCRRQDAVPAR